MQASHLPFCLFSPLYKFICHLIDKMNYSKEKLLQFLLKNMDL